MTRCAMFLGLLLLSLVGLSGCAPDLKALAQDNATICLKINGWGTTVDFMRSNPDTATDVNVSCNGNSIAAPGVINVPLRVVPILEK